jgi:MazG family protein
MAAVDGDPEPSFAAGEELGKLDEVVRTLRERCPWDREQTHLSLVRHLLEEAYEAIEAIDALSDPPTATEAAHLADELGDLLFQVWFHALLGSEKGLFDLAGIAKALGDKLVARHPHVFGDGTASDARAVVANWERGKLDEKNRTSLMDGIPAATPALAATAKVERKASGAGLGFELTGDRERLAALFERVAGSGAGAGASGTLAGVANEDLGELLFGLARLGADAGRDPEAAVRRAAARFKAQFLDTELAASAEGVKPDQLHELDADRRRDLWREAGERSHPDT